MDEFDDIEEPFDDEEGDELSDPTYRITIRNRRVRLTSWVPWLARNGPSANFLRERDEAGVAIADLTLLGEGDKEVAVRFYADGGDRAGAERTLLRWARAVGYRRVWLSDRFEELEPSPEQIGVAQVHCPSCGVVWRDSSPEFWLTVRKQGAFPHWCVICGCELPQWAVRPKPRGPRRPTAERGSPDDWSAVRESTERRQRKT